jgi:hypothetical protein
MNHSPVGAFCVDAFLLARYGGPGDGRPDGRAWERAVSAGLWSAHTTRRQHAGTLGLFGSDGRSGVHHELDGAGHGPAPDGEEMGIWLEAKARAEIDKSDVAVFAFKSLDLYREQAAQRPEATTAGAWWPVLVSSEPCTETVHRSCLAMGVMLCEPSLLALPALLRVAGRPMADMHLDERLLAEAVRLGELLCKPMQRRWVIDPDARTINLSIDEPGARDVADAIFVQAELTDRLLDYYDSVAPGELERRGEALSERLATFARVW